MHFNFLKEPNYLNENNKKLLLRKGIQFHWKNNNYGSFDDFLKNLSSRKRKLIKKERSCIKDHILEGKLLNGNEITNIHWDFF